MHSPFFFLNPLIKIEPTHNPFNTVPPNNKQHKAKDKMSTNLFNALATQIGHEKTLAMAKEWIQDEEESVAKAKAKAMEAIAYAKAKETLEIYKTALKKLTGRKITMRSMSKSFTDGQKIRICKDHSIVASYDAMKDSLVINDKFYSSISTFAKMEYFHREVNGWTSCEFLDSQGNWQLTDNLHG